jgi:CheY-like chemotaxis protein
MQTGQIFIVDADADDREMIREIVNELNIPNDLAFFGSGQDLLNHMASAAESPFIILCEVSLPKMDGFELRQRLLSGDKKFRSVPFIFFSNKASDTQIQKAYDLSAHGFFLKPNTYAEMLQSFKTMLQYWQISKMPQKVTT